MTGETDTLKKQLEDVIIQRDEVRTQLDEVRTQAGSAFAQVDSLTKENEDLKTGSNVYAALSREATEMNATLHRQLECYRRQGSVVRKYSGPEAEVKTPTDREFMENRPEISDQQGYEQNFDPHFSANRPSREGSRGNTPYPISESTEIPISGYTSISSNLMPAGSSRNSGEYTDYSLPTPLQQRLGDENYQYQNEQGTRPNSQAAAEEKESRSNHYDYDSQQYDDNQDQHAGYIDQTEGRQSRQNHVSYNDNVEYFSPSQHSSANTYILDNQSNQHGNRGPIQSGPQQILQITPAGYNFTSSAEYEETRPAKKHMIFRGTPRTLSLKDFFCRMEENFKPNWTDMQKRQFTIKHLDASNGHLYNLTTMDVKSYPRLKQLLQMKFGNMHPSFDLSKWNQATRYKGTSFTDWGLSENGISLIDNTAPRWDNKQLSYDELSIIMNRLCRMVPKRIFSKYITIDNSWDKDALLNFTFMELMNMIAKDERYETVSWRAFEDSYFFPEAPHPERKTYVPYEYS